MKFQETEIMGVHIVDVEPHGDARGDFARSYCAEEFEKAGLGDFSPVQMNVSGNAARGTLRGLHYQDDPTPDPKLVRCTSGAVFDVAVDLRRDSETFRQWTGIELSAENRKALFVPAGCAHGFLTLTDNCEVFYVMGALYVADLARGVRWDDPAFAIAWPFEPVAMAERDANYPDFEAS
ncbi:MAG: dTDP-4-dehydrorhamnose 3,5-epimerase [Alphaproteobacteria bacterium]|nr:dTDP-4-dehydrorhamnose 3,5-epimerase [Alphaproteobacteria bacterium]